MSAKRAGRNDPCPCGSGKKYKRCCLRKDEAPPPFTRTEFLSARAKLERFVFEGHPKATIDEWERVLWGGAPPVDLEDLFEVGDDLFLHWLGFEVIRPDGRRMVDDLLDGREPPLGLEEPLGTLTAGERAYLEAMAQVRTKLYEIRAVRPGVLVEVTELETGSRLTIREQSMSRMVKRWDIVAARVVPRGKSGLPEFDWGGPVFDQLRGRELEARIEATLSSKAGKEPGGHPTNGVACMILQAWATVRIPKMINRDGHELLLSHVLFDVVDEPRLVRGLDGCPELVRDDQDDRTWHWCWDAVGHLEEGDAIRGSIQVGVERLVATVTSRELSIEVRALIEQAAPGAATHRLTEYEDVSARMSDPDMDTPVPSVAQAEELLGSEELDEFIGALTIKHYKQWVDEPVPLLEGATPRAAAKNPKLVPEVVSLLKGLERAYFAALEQGQPGHDPTWMWAELGLEAHADAPRQGEHTPRMGHETMAALVKGLGSVVETVARDIRREHHPDEPPPLVPESLTERLGARRFIEEYAKRCHREGAAPEVAIDDANLLGTHLEYMVNFELGRRKTFWVDGSLAWMLGETTLDIEGSELQLPFDSFAVVFDDRTTLGKAERLLSLDRHCHLRGTMLRALTAYVVAQPDERVAKRIRMYLVMDAFDGQWPYLVVRELFIEADARLDEILSSVLPEVAGAGRDAFFSSPHLAKLVHLVINAILYATSAAGTSTGEVATVTKRPPKGGKERARKGAPLSGEEVFYLPGTIDITTLRTLESVARAPGGSELMHRFMVRGHWRRANPSWKDQRPRWIAPYWKGPDMATVIERAYRLK